ncbi:hypothetical protein FN846DRAFT_994070 [Sphaerosporella brunnea]|uniref:Uncharacterized protein n=1 Tax=Sphaerosporella brunnea TaxID=1250544 RepID=A0A5J5F6R7_9PEZI|nr:hypothetical protein FN846DRAFT_994070 [Sphaerosporella brunnea]
MASILATRLESTCNSAHLQSLSTTWVQFIASASRPGWRCEGGVEEAVVISLRPRLAASQEQNRSDFRAAITSTPANFHGFPQWMAVVGARLNCRLAAASESSLHTAHVFTTAQGIPHPQSPVPQAINRSLHEKKHPRPLAVPEQDPSMPRSKQAKIDTREPSTEPEESSSASGQEESSESEPANDSYTTNPDTSRAGVENSNANPAEA